MKLIATLILTLSFGAFAKSFTLMTYNVENLFDTGHDEGKDDYTYLPLELKRKSPEVQAYCASIDNEYYRESCFNFDWSEKVLNQKIKNISQVIKSANPDIMVLEEVENKNVVTMLVKRGLPGMGYKHISLIEGPDSRGIDVAIVSRFPIVNEKLHLVNLDGVAKETRGILQADIRIEGKTVSVFANHWPSQSNPSMARLLAAQTLLDAALDTDSNAVIAAGDFNTVEQDDPHGINLVIKPNFHVADEKASRMGHYVGEGSHWYRGEYSFLDKMFILKRKRDGVYPLYGTFGVHKKSWMTHEREWVDYETGEVSVHRVPNRFDTATGEGFSDHLPLVMSFAY